MKSPRGPHDGQQSFRQIPSLPPVQKKFRQPEPIKKVRYNLKVNWHQKFKKFNVIVVKLFIQKRFGGVRRVVLVEAQHCHLGLGSNQGIINQGSNLVTYNLSKSKYKSRFLSIDNSASIS